MAKIDRVQEVSIELLRPYERNAKLHGDDQIDAIKRSIKEFGFISPCLIDKEFNIIAGHGRVIASKQLGLKKIPCVFIEGLTEEQKKAYILADNRLTEMGRWDFDVVAEELEDISIDMSAFGFELKQENEWFNRENRFDDSRQEGNDEYNEFLDKFEQPKTTDDCYTPDNIYDVVADYVSARFNKKRENFVRPFFPGGDYENEKYKEGSVVVDNPPFSIFSKIVDFYIDRNIDFFLFAPSVTALNYLSRGSVSVIPLMTGVLYENGAVVPTSFLTNMCEEGIALDNDPEFRKKLVEANEINEKAMYKELPKYDYPYDVLTAAKAGWLSKYGQRIILKRESCVLIDALDEQKNIGKAIYGHGLLLSERAAAERAAALTFKLSEREKEIQKGLK